MQINKPVDPFYIAYYYSYITREFVEYTTYIRALEMTTQQIIQNKELFHFDLKTFNDWITLLSKSGFKNCFNYPFVWEAWERIR